MVDTFSELVESVPDDHGCRRPASIYPTPGYWNDGLGNEWPDVDWGSQKVSKGRRRALTIFLNPRIPLEPDRVIHRA